MTNTVRPPSLSRWGIKAGYKTAASRAKALGVSRVYLLNAETGRGSLGDAVVLRMAEAYSVPVEQVRTELRRLRRQFAQRILSNLRRKA